MPVEKQLKFRTKYPTSVHFSNFLEIAMTFCDGNTVPLPEKMFAGEKKRKKEKNAVYESTRSSPRSESVACSVLVCDTRRRVPHGCRRILVDLRRSSVITIITILGTSYVHEYPLWISKTQQVKQRKISWSQCTKVCRLQLRKRVCTPPSPSENRFMSKMTSVR